MAYKAYSILSDLEVGQGPVNGLGNLVRMEFASEVVGDYWADFTPDQADELSVILAAAAADARDRMAAADG